MSSPSFVQQLLYFGGVKAPEAHRPWITQTLATPSRKLAVLLALPNACIVLVAAIVVMLVNGGIGSGLIMAAAAPLVVLVSVLVPSITRRRIAFVRRRQGI